MRHWVLAGVLSLLWWMVPSTSATAAPGREEMSTREAATKAVELNRQLAELFQQKQYEAAAALCRQGTELPLPDGARSSYHYNWACCLARLGKIDDALTQLEAAVTCGYDDLCHMQDDPDLAALRKAERWTALIEKLSAGAVPPRYEKGEDGTVITGKPAGGLSYRIFQAPEATEDAPHRLVLWLHPSGGLANNLPAKLLPILRKHSLSLVVFENKSARNWTGADARRMRSTVKALAVIDGVDGERPLLLGYSAGGQLALSLWAGEPKAWGGIITSAAYPMGLPEIEEGALHDETPVLALVGAADPSVRMWGRALENWSQLALPVVVNYVPEGKHQWLFGDKQVTHLDAWLSDVMAGTLPSGTVGSPPPPPAPIIGVRLDGNRITMVAEGFPAQQAGLKVDDIIEQANGTDITGEKDLRAVLAATRPGDVVKLAVRRGEELLHIDVTPVVFDVKLRTLPRRTSRPAP